MNARPGHVRDRGRRNWICASRLWARRSACHATRPLRHAWSCFQQCCAARRAAPRKSATLHGSTARLGIPAGSPAPGRRPASENTRCAAVLLFAVACRGQGAGWPSVDARMLGWFDASMREASQSRSCRIRDPSPGALTARYGSGPSASRALRAFRLEHSEHVIAAVDADGLAGGGGAVVRTEVDRCPAHRFKRSVCP